MTSQSWAHWFPFLRWQRPSGPLLRGEIIAGVTVALVIIPQSVAYAALAGMPLVTGVYAAFIPALVAVLWSASPRLSVGPTALTSLLVAASLHGLAEPGSSGWVMLAIWLALISGAMQLALGAGKFGWILNLVSAPVLAGFTQAATILIIVSQVPALLGLQGTPGDWLGAPKFDLAAAGFGLATLALLVVARRFAPQFPMVMVAMIGASALSYATHYASAGGAVIGAVPGGLPVPVWPGMPALGTLAALVVPAMVISLVSFLETASSAKVESQATHQPWNDNQDLMAQGLAKIASGLTGSFPTSSSFSRSALNLYAGARTGWATVATVVAVGLMLLWFTPALYHVPSAVLAAVVISAVSGLFKPSVFLRLWGLVRIEALILATTFFITIITAPRIYWGVLTGVLLGLTHFLYQRLHPRIIEVGLHADGSLRDRHLWHLGPLGPRMFALRMDAELDFASASTLERTVADYLAQHPGTADIVLFAQPINRVDATGIEVFAAVRRSLVQQGIALHISGMKLPVEALLRRAGELTDSPLLHLYRTDAEALAHFANLQD